MREETGFRVALIRVVGTYSRPRWRAGSHSVLFAATVVDGDPGDFDPNETIEARSFNLDNLPDSLLWWQRRMVADAASGIAGVAWSHEALVPGDGDRAATVARSRRDPAFAEQVQAALTRPPYEDAERLDVGSLPLASLD